MKENDHRSNRADDYQELLNRLDAEAGTAPDLDAVDIENGDTLNLYNNLGNNYAGAVRRYKQKGEHAPQ